MLYALTIPACSFFLIFVPLSNLKAPLQVKAKQVETIRNLFHRQLRIPLADHAQTLEQYKDWEQEQGVQIGTDTDALSGLPGGVASAYKTADQMSKARVTYESNIATGKPVDGDLLQHYLVSLVLFSCCSLVPVLLNCH